MQQRLRCGSKRRIKGMNNQKNLRERYMSGTYQNGIPLEGRETFMEAVSQKGSSFEDLNFNKNVIGSDETGKGEVFRPLIVVAAYVKKEHVEALLKEDIRDSKSYKAHDKKSKGDERVKYETAKKKICEIGKKLTGFTSYSDFEEQRKNGIVMEKACVTFAANVVPNGVYNDNWKTKKTKKGDFNENELMREYHAAAINALAEKVNYDFVVVDNFEKSHPEHIQDKIGLPKDRIIIAEKADKFAIAVACASVIAKYLGYLYIERLAVDYELDEFEDFGKTGDFTVPMCERLWKKLENPRLFFRNYIKKFDNVIERLNAMEEGLGKLYDEAE